jgi:hypothetical protein
VQKIDQKLKHNRVAKHGHALPDQTEAAATFESRNSDAITVWPGPKKTFSYLTIAPVSEEKVSRLPISVSFSLVVIDNTVSVPVLRVGRPQRSSTRRLGQSRGYRPF